MANLGRKAGIYYVRFRYQAKEHKRSLKVRERSDAEAARDVDLTCGFVFARSRKQSRRRSEVVRRIDMHPELHRVLAEWRRRRPKGQFVLSDADTLEPIDKDRANRCFWQPMRTVRLRGPRGRSRAAPWPSLCLARRRTPCRKLSASHESTHLSE